MAGPKQVDRKVQKTIERQDLLAMRKKGFNAMLCITILALPEDVGSRRLAAVLWSNRGADGHQDHLSNDDGHDFFTTRYLKPTYPSTDATSSLSATGSMIMPTFVIWSQCGP